MADTNLLKQYVDDGSQQAFAALVEKYIGLVYSSAFRQLRDRHEAEDVTQAVFTALATGAAKIGPEVILCGWLLTATRNLSSNRLRAEGRRKHHEQEAAAMSRTTGGGAPTPDPWREVAPLLDEAVAGLGKTNKGALLLRYFEGKSVREVAAALGIAEDAAKQRVARGVDELRTFFTGKGVNLAALVVAGLLASKAVHAAPPGLAFSTVSAATAAGLTPNGVAAAEESVIGASVAGGAGAAAAGLFATTTAKIISAVTALILVAGTTALWVRANHPDGGKSQQGGSNAEMSDPTAGERPAVGEIAPPLALSGLDGNPVQLDQFRGKYVVLHFWTPSRKNWAFEGAELRHVWDRFAQDPRFMMLSVGIGVDSAAARASAQRQRLEWPQLLASDDSAIGVRESAKATDKYVLVTRAVLVIGPDGRVIDRITDARGAYKALDKALAKNPSPRNAPGVTVTVEHNPPGASTLEYKFPTLPTIARGDVGERASFKVVGGEASPFAGFGVLTDGSGAKSFDDPKSAFFFKEWWLTGRLRMDLGRAINIAQVNTYSWHKDVRAAQVYRLYGADGSAAGFNEAPGVGIDPSSCGWSLVASVDTRADDGRSLPGQDAVSIRAGVNSIGRFRYLLFVVSVTEIQDGYGNTFYNEIDVIESKLTVDPAR